MALATPIPELMDSAMCVLSRALPSEGLLGINQPIMPLSLVQKGLGLCYTPYVCMCVCIYVCMYVCMSVTNIRRATMKVVCYSMF